jgi:aryl-alcohol dehydrogenase-like predicted oxidoreductase
MWDLTEFKIKKAQLLIDFCKKESLDVVSVSYLWCLINVNVVSVISNVRDIKQLRQNIKFSESKLSFEILTKLEQIFNNDPINQYTNIKYEITKRKL